MATDLSQFTSCVVKFNSLIYVCSFTHSKQEREGGNVVYCVGGVERKNSEGGVIHYAIFCATCLAILLRHKLHEKLHSVTYPTIIKSRNIFVAASVARSRIKFYFSQRSRQRCNGLLKHCTVSNTPLATCLAMFCAFSQ